ncbi:MAG TPA: hypothetical protein VJZ91_10210, partial [Blastocatellia bacterium]|nr:hypothetical protein [Blastocatellia bacterium]
GYRGVASNSPGAGAGTGSVKPREVAKDRRADAAEPPRRAPLSPAEQKRMQLLAKLHPDIAAAVERLRNKSAAPAPAEAKFVRNGKAEIQIWLTSKSDAVMARLKQLGLEVVAEPKSAKLVIGRIALDKLAALAEVAEVRYVAPQTQ